MYTLLKHNWDQMGALVSKLVNFCFLFNEQFSTPFLWSDLFRRSFPPPLGRHWAGGVKLAIILVWQTWLISQPNDHHWVCFWPFEQTHAHLWPAGGHLAGLWWCSSLQKGGDGGPAAGLLPSYGLLQYPDVLACLLIVPPCSGHYANRQSKPSCNSSLWYAILVAALPEPFVWVVESLSWWHERESTTSI